VNMKQPFDTIRSSICAQISIILISRGSDNTQIILGKKQVKVFNDGDFRMSYNLGCRFIRWNYNPSHTDPSDVFKKHHIFAGLKSVLSFEIFSASLHIIDSRLNDPSRKKRMIRN